MKKTTTVLQFKVLIERDGDGWYVASVPELPGCYTQAKTLETLRMRIKEVIELVLDSDTDARNEKLKSPASIPSFFATEDIHIPYYA